MRFAISVIFLLWALPTSAATLITGNKAEDTVSFIDLESGKEIARLETGPAPHEVAVSPDGKIAAVVAYGGASIDVFAVDEPKRLRRIDLGPYNRPHGIMWIADTMNVAATTEGSGHLVVVDIEAAEVVAAHPTGARGSHMVALDKAGSRAFTANMGSDSVTALDLVAGEARGKIETGDVPEGIALTPDGTELWIANRDDDTVTVFDAESFEALATLEVGRTPIRIAISPDGANILTSNFRDGTLSVIDRDTRKIARTIKAGEPDDRIVTLLFGPEGDTVFAALTGRGEIAEIDVKSGAVRRHLKAGRGADGLGYSPLSASAE